MALRESQKKYLRKLGHQLKPTVLIGDGGLSGAVLAEFDSTLQHHELIKVKVRVGDRDARDGIIKALCERKSAELIQRIGNVALLYQENPDDKKIVLPRT